MALQDKYIYPFTDFGFKKLFGLEPTKKPVDRLSEPGVAGKAQDQRLDLRLQ